MIFTNFSFNIKMKLMLHVSCNMIDGLYAIDKSIKWPNQSMYRIDQSSSQSINQWINGLINQTINRAMNQSITRSSDQSIERSINQWINGSINQSINDFIVLFTHPDSPDEIRIGRRTHGHDENRRRHPGRTGQSNGKIRITIPSTDPAELHRWKVIERPVDRSPGNLSDAQRLRPRKPSQSSVIRPQRLPRKFIIEPRVRPRRKSWRGQ